MQSLTVDNVIEFVSPQKENGYTPIANELLEQIISFDFSKRELLVIMSIARNTYGYNRKTDALSTIQIANLIKMNRPDVSRALTKLVENKVIIKHESGRKSHGFFVNELSINKHYNEWITDSNLPPVTGSKTPTDSKSPQVVKNGLTGSKSHTQQVVKHHTHKAIKTTKESISKKTLIPDDFSISERVIKWAEKNGHKNLDKHLENFILVCNAKGYQNINWDSAFMLAVRGNWAKLTETKKQNSNNEINGMKLI